MWSSPVFFCRNGPCRQQKKPRGSVQLEPQGAHKDPEQHQQIHVQQQPPHLRVHRAVVQGDPPPCEQAQIQQAPEDAAGFLQAGGQALQREHPAQPCQQHHGAHRTASLNLFSLPLPHHASLLLLCRSPGGFSPLYHIRAVIYQRAEGECTNRHSFWGRDPKTGWSHKQKTGLPHSDAEQACLVTEKDPGHFLAGSVILC